MVPGLDNGRFRGFPGPTPAAPAFFQNSVEVDFCRFEKPFVTVRTCPDLRAEPTRHCRLVLDYAVRPPFPLSHFALPFSIPDRYPDVDGFDLRQDEGEG